MSIVSKYALADYGEKLQNEEYIRVVLGFSVPLNESYPYSPTFQRHVLYEQYLLEGFWDDLKDMKDTTANLFKSFKEVSTDPKRLVSFNSLVGKTTRFPLKQIVKLLNSIIEKLGKYSDKFPTVIKWANKTKQFILDVDESAKNIDGWKGSISRLSLGLAVKFLWDKIGSFVNAANDGFKEIAKKLAGDLGEGELDKLLEKVKEFLSEQVSPIVKIFKEEFAGVAKKIATQFSGIGAWFDWAKTAFDGAKFVLDFLSAPLSKFQGLKVTTESLLREYVRGVLHEKSYGKSEGDNRMIRVDNMRIRVELDNVDYRATKHSRERQSRHKDEKGRGFGISSKSINNAISAAMGMIINDYANGELKNGERFLIVARTGPGTPLNIVGALNMKKGPDDFGVITVMRKENFMTELPTYEVKV